MVESALYIVTTYTEMKWLTYDLESTFLQKGYKRGDTLILEIALFKGKREAFQSLVNPVSRDKEDPCQTRRRRAILKDHQPLDQALIGKDAQRGQTEIAGRKPTK